MNFSEWWKKPMRVMQYNLQVKDTPIMDPKQISQETVELGANVVVMNVGGIYAWYPSKVMYHHINEFLPKGTDLLRELIREFHPRDIRFVARFDFSITDDVTYLKKPQWFARHKDNTPYYRGEKRMGNWSLFLNTCALGGYRNEEVAAPVIREALMEYDIDGVFLNAPHASACFCSRCQEKYEKLYGKEMPDTPEEFETRWLSECMKENIGTIYRAVKDTKKEVPLILYYTPYSGKSKSFGRFDRDSIYDRYQTADLICTESQNILSHGVKNLPPDIHPIISMKSGQLPNREKLPFGIIHSCPGMDWRHVGMPEAEYLPWMAQVPASGGVIWHSVTGYPSTITDKRVLAAVGKIDHMIMKAENFMDGASYRSDVCLLWVDSDSAKGIADAFVKSHIQFDLMQDYDFRPQDLNKYGVVFVPDGYPVTDEIADELERYAEEGGVVIRESRDEEELKAHSKLYGISKETYKSEYLTASYIRIEQEGESLKKGMDTDKLVLRGDVCYLTPQSDTKVLATLVPPFAPYEVVGAPPERASMPVSHTDIPLLTWRTAGKGSVVVIPFSIGNLVTEYHLADHYDLIRNLVKDCLGDRADMEVKAPHDVQVTAYEKKDMILVHFVNETGKRPLLDNIPVTGISFSVKVPRGKRVKNIASVIEETEVVYERDGDCVEVTIPELTIWDMIKIEME